MYICYITQEMWMCFCVGVSVSKSLCVSACIFVLMTMINVIIRFLIWLLKMRMVHRQFPLDLQHCTLNPQESAMVQLRSFLFHVHDDDGFDVLHLTPVIVILVIIIHGIKAATGVHVSRTNTYPWYENERNKKKGKRSEEKTVVK